MAAALLIRFFRSGGARMLKMMGGSPGGHDHHVHPEPGNRPHTGSRQHRPAAAAADYEGVVTFPPRPLPWRRVSRR